MRDWVSPLIEIEAAVHERAQSISLDLSGPNGKRRLRTLIDEEVRRWQAESQQGLRPVHLVEPELVAERAYRNLAGYGPLETLLADPDVWEIMVNAPDEVFVRRHRGASGYHDEVFHDDAHVARTLTKILDEASGSHRKLDPTEGLQDARLDDGSRIHIVHADIGREGHLLVNIRKFTGLPLRSLDELVANGTLDTHVARFLRACVRARMSVVFSGPPGAGKTTLLACCAAELDPSLRVVVAEEVFETDLPLANVAHMQTRPQRGDRAEVDLRRLVTGFLRMAPDVAIVGEVRDREDHTVPLKRTLSSVSCLLTARSPANEQCECYQLELMSGAKGTSRRAGKTASRRRSRPAAIEALRFEGALLALAADDDPALAFVGIAGLRDAADSLERYQCRAGTSPRLDVGGDRQLARRQPPGSPQEARRQP